MSAFRRYFCEFMLSDIAELTIKILLKEESHGIKDQPGTKKLERRELYETIKKTMRKHTRLLYTMQIRDVVENGKN